MIFIDLSLQSTNLMRVENWSNNQLMLQKENMYSQCIPELIIQSKLIEICLWWCDNKCLTLVKIIWNIEHQMFMRTSYFQNLMILHSSSLLIARGIL